ncbi:MAG: alpha/beta hydrolase [Gammaproteobacteria bacterium]|nr:alpha/beta hydrolase [Gammaproteobacteria bacterium]MDH5650346.1 alpha/beta hydrolase [Gammaproteobacteria bacterium]
MMETLECVEIGPKDADYSVIWLHGLGANGHDFEPIVPELNIPAQKKVRFVLPHAPSIPVTINSGVVMPAWYDIASMNFLDQQDELGIRVSESLVKQLIDREVTRGVPTDHIFLVGFSQGGAIALHTGLRYPQPLAGILALSTYLPLDLTVNNERHEANQTTPIMMAHGTHDPVVPLRLGEMSRDYLQELGYQVNWRQYYMEHSVVPEEINDISDWFSARISG